MTIAIGMKCSDGVVFCADRQITDATGLKYERDKILCREESGREMATSLMLTYAGNPNSAATMFDRVWEQVHKLGPTHGRRVLGGVFKCKHSRGLKTLLAVSVNGTAPVMFRTESEVVYEADTEYIGAGDSSVVRYLSKLFLDEKKRPSLVQAKFIGCLLVSAANRFVDGCSGGPDVALINNWGRVEQSRKRSVEKYCGVITEMERAFSAAFESFRVVELDGVPLERLESQEGRKKADEIFARNTRKLRELASEIYASGRKPRGLRKP
jgi:hypothetical protein